jgi:hypothetical protein
MKIFLQSSSIGSFDCSVFGPQTDFVRLLQVNSEVWAYRLPPALAPDSDDMVSMISYCRTSNPE